MGRFSGLSDEGLKGLAKRYGTPLYLYDLDCVRAQVAKLKQVLPAAQLRYAVKANPNGAILKALADRGVGAEVISLGELERALHAGMPAERMLLGGPRQDGPLIERAAQAGVGQVSLDSLSQLESWLERPGPGQRFFLRLNPALDPRTHEHLATGAASSKFGMSHEEAIDAAETPALSGRLAGMHVHAGSQLNDIAVYREIFEKLEFFYERFELSALNIGGGFAVPDFPLKSFAAQVTAFTERYDLELILEPGRFLVAACGVLLSEVLHVKVGERRHLITDAGMADMLRPALYGASHPIRVLGPESGEVVVADIDGPLCENADRLARDYRLPATKAGDLIVIEEAGAYGFAMASNYASSLRPAEVVVEAGHSRLARKRERPEDLWSLEDA